MKLIVFPLLAAWLGSAQGFVTPGPMTTVQLGNPGRNLDLSSQKYTSPTQLHGVSSMLDGAIKLSSTTTESITSSPLFEFFLQTLISYAVPTFFTLVVIFFAAMAFRNKDDKMSGFFERETAVSELYSDLYGDTKPSRGPGGGGFNFGGNRNPKALRRNLGIPASEYLKITNLNERYDSYDFSLAKATKSKAFAASQYRSRSFDRALSVALAGDDQELPAYAKSMLLEAEKNFLTKGKSLVAEIQELEAALAQEAIDEELKRLGLDKFEMEPATDDIIDVQIEDTNATQTTNETAASKGAISMNLPFGKKSAKGELQKTIGKLKGDLQDLELNFLQDVIAAVGTKRGMGLRAALVGDITARGSGGLLTQLEDRPLSALVRSTSGSDGKESTEPKTLYVLDFPGDVQASQLNGLREEVTAIIRNAKPGDEALVVLQSGGGTVTGYGLAAGQLVRLKDAGLFLTMAVEQVAASGGYMMACVADRIVASPFAVLGSIGVISEVPNAYERLKQEGIEFQTVTAGKFKRTLTPTKKVTKGDLEKSKEDLEQVLTQFSGFVKENRPSLDIDSVATGETWFGQAALDKGLCDDIKTVDDILLNYVDLGYKVYEISYKPPPEVPQGLAQLLPATKSGSSDSLPKQAIRWMVSAVAEEVQATLSASNSAEQRVMAKDDTSDRVQMRD